MFGYVYAGRRHAGLGNVYPRELLLHNMIHDFNNWPILAFVTPAAAAISDHDAPAS